MPAYLFCCFCRSTHTLFGSTHWFKLCLAPAYSLVRACMLDSKVRWHQAPGWFQPKCIINCFEEKIWSLNCLCFFFLTGLASFRVIYIVLINIVLKGFWYPALYSDWYHMLLFDSLLLSASWNVLSYSDIWAYSVSDFEKCTTLFRYFSLLCYLELQSNWANVDPAVMLIASGSS